MKALRRYVLSKSTSSNWRDIVIYRRISLNYLPVCFHLTEVSKQLSVKQQIKKMALALSVHLGLHVCCLYTFIMIWRVKCLYQLNDFGVPI